MIVFSKFQVPSFYGFGMVEKGYVRGISIDNRQYFSIAMGKTGTKVVKGDKKKVQVISKCKLYPPDKIKLFSSVEIRVTQ